MTAKWFEIWADAGLEPPYLLTVLASRSPAEGVVVIDPQEGGKRVFKSHSYEEVKMWLLEDEYERVTGRVDLDA